MAGAMAAGEGQREAVGILRCACLWSARWGMLAGSGWGDHASSRAGAACVRGSSCLAG
jgi:hypothetical protein